MQCCLSSLSVTSDSNIWMSRPKWSGKWQRIQSAKCVYSKLEYISCYRHNYSRPESWCYIILIWQHRERDWNFCEKVINRFGDTEVCRSLPEVVYKAYAKQSSHYRNYKLLKVHFSLHSVYMTLLISTVWMKYMVVSYIIREYTLVRSSPLIYLIYTYFDIFKLSWKNYS
jgi:hypothetical protein